MRRARGPSAQSSLPPSTLPNSSLHSTTHSHRDPEPFDWYQRYAALKDLIGQYVRKDDGVLMAGCGNSKLSEDMYEDGYTHITNVDISRVVVDQMLERHRGKTSMAWRQMNICALDFADASFNVVLDKGTLDSILCGEGSINNVANMCMEVSRVLKPDGVFLIVSYGIPDNRLQYLQEETYKWRVSVHTVPKPSCSSLVAADPKDKANVHYVYICQKGSHAPGPPAEENAGGGEQEEEEGEMAAASSAVPAPEDTVEQM